MNAISNTLMTAAIALWLPALAAAQTPAPAAPPPGKVGFVRLVNTLAQGEGKLRFFVDDQELNPDGYELGDITGGIGLPPGNHQISIKRDGVTAGSTRVTITPNNTTTLIPFAEQVPATDTKKAHWTVRILRLKQTEPETKRSATFVSVSQTPEHEVEMREPNGKWTRITVKRLATSTSPINYPEGYVPLRTKADKLPSIPVGEPGNYVVVLYDDAAGKLQALNLQDYKYLSAE